MRTTLNIENDTLAAAKEIARMEHTSVGVVVSRLLRQALTGGEATDSAADTVAHTTTGFRPFPRRGEIINDETINQLRDNEGI